MNDAEATARVAALEQRLHTHDLVDPADVERVAQRYEDEYGPTVGARIVARAWTDPAYRRWLLSDGTAAALALGGKRAQMERLVVVENTRRVHNVVVCTLCSCYPWGVLGLPPSWYKDPAYRARVVREPRTVLAEMGLDVDPDVEIRVWDSTSEVRYLVLPLRPSGTDGFDEERLAALVSRDAMVGVARADSPSADRT